MSTWLSDNQALSTRSLLPPETWDPLPLSPVCNPYCKPSADNTSSSELDVGTFRPNQYKPLCPPSTPSKPDAQIQIYSLVIQKHRHNLQQKHPILDKSKWCSTQQKYITCNGGNKILSTQLYSTRLIRQGNKIKRLQGYVRPYVVVWVG